MDEAGDEGEPLATPESPTPAARKKRAVKVPALELAEVVGLAPGPESSSVVSAAVALSTRSMRSRG